MLTRQVTRRYKATCSAELARTIESEILPLLRQQNGFPEWKTFIAPDRKVESATSERKA